MTAVEHVQRVLDGGYQSISIQQYGPDGSEIIGLLLFHSCPLCRAVVPAPLTGLESVDFIAEHSASHIREARVFDRLAREIEALRSAGEPPS